MKKFLKETKKLFTTTRTVSNTGRIQNSFGGNVPARARKCLQKFLCRDGSSVICVEINYLTVLPRWRCHLFFVNNCSPFYLSFIHFALKPVFASRNVRCFLRLVNNDFP